MTTTSSNNKYRIDIHSHRDLTMRPLKSILLNTTFDDVSSIRMKISNNMDVLIYDKQTAPKKSYIFNALEQNRKINLENFVSNKSNSHRPGNQDFDAENYTTEDLDEDQIEEIKEVFDLFDSDGSG